MHSPATIDALSTRFKWFVWVGLMTGRAWGHQMPSPDANNRYIKVTLLPGSVRVAYTVFFGDLPGAAERRRLDADRNGAIDDAEAKAFGGRLLSEVAPAVRLVVYCLVPEHLAPAPAYQVQRAVTRQTHQPGPRLPKRRIVPASLLPDLHERIMGRVRCKRRITRDAHGHSMQPAAPLRVERSERRAILGCAARDQILGG